MKRKILFILLLYFTIFPIFVSAENSGIFIKCNKSNLNAGESTECLITGKSSSDVTAISATLKSGSAINFESFKPSSKWLGDDISNGKIDIYTSDDISGNFEIGTLKIKVKDGVYNINDFVQLNDVLYYNSSYNSYSVDSASFNIRIVNNDSKLKSLTIEGIDLNPKFSSDIFKYTVVTSRDSINIVAQTNDDKAKINGDGVVSLKNGINNIEIIVEAENGSKTTYSIEINAKLSNDDNKDNSSTSDVISNDNSNNGNNSTTTISNPKTGQSYIIFAILLLAISSISIIYFKGKKCG